MDKKMDIPFSPPDISELEVQEVAEALRSGWITTGPRTKQLERNIAAYVGTEKCVCLNSQTACAEQALRVLGVGPGDEVIVPAYTYTASASIVCHVGAKLVLVDSQPGSLEMDYDALEAAITHKTKAIIPVDLHGMPCDYDEINAIAESYDPMAIYNANARIRRVIDALDNGTVKDYAYEGEPYEGCIAELKTALLKGASWHKPDHYYLLHDFADYQKMRLASIRATKDKRAFAKLCLKNIAGAGKFSSDRTIKEYAEEIWFV